MGRELSDKISQQDSLITEKRKHSDIGKATLHSLKLQKISFHIKMSNRKIKVKVHTKLLKEKR